MKVFGIGFNKTGTSTLGDCFRILGARHLSTRGDLLKWWTEGRWTDIFDVLDAYQTFEDWPYPLMYKELFERYGDNAKFILTTRKSPQAWVDSIKSHALTTHPSKHLRTAALGYRFPHGYEAEHIALYNAHNDAVRHFFSQNGRASQFTELCWENGDGWQQLCKFLGVKVPNKPFPHSNTKTDRLKAVNIEWKHQNELLIAEQLARLSRSRQN